MRKRYISVLGIAIAVCILIMTSPPAKEALSKFGSSGEEVFKIQERLLKWGYYNGDVDGIYGSRTVRAVMRFQANHGLTPDGIAGPATLTRLGLPVGNSGGGSVQSGSSSYENNVQLLARAINGEARGEPYTGQVAVGAVIMNRVRHASFPNTIAGVVYQPGAFTAVSDGQIHAQMSESCVRAARDALNGWDPVGGAIYYYNPGTATNRWIRTRPVVTTIGKHVFCN